jgi:energy-converting hydrogenase Eha subunit E
MSDAEPIRTSIGQETVRFILLCASFAFGGICIGQVVVLWIMGGEPPWVLSAPLFFQTILNAFTAATLFVLGCRPRGVRISIMEKLALISAAGAFAISVGLSLVFQTWRELLDWMSLSGAAILTLYLTWIVVRVRESRSSG